MTAVAFPPPARPFNQLWDAVCLWSLVALQTFYSKASYKFGWPWNSNLEDENTEHWKIVILNKEHNTEIKLTSFWLGSNGMKMYI